MATSFEKIMGACIEAKKETPKSKSTKKLNETKTKKARTKKFENDEFDNFDDPELEVDTFDDEMSDIDDVLVVVDPELDAEDVETVTGELQDIIDDTDESEIPATDEYIDDYTYSCPICGSTFFSGKEMVEGDECPVCGETPNAFVLAGQVAEADLIVGETDDEEFADVDDTGDIDDFDDEYVDDYNEFADDGFVDDYGYNFDDNLEEQKRRARAKARAKRLSVEQRSRVNRVTRSARPTYNRKPVRPMENRVARPTSRTRTLRNVPTRRPIRPTENRYSTPIRRTPTRVSRMSRPTYKHTRPVENMYSTPIRRTPVSRTYSNRPMNRPMPRLASENTLRNRPTYTRKPNTRPNVTNTRNSSLHLDESTFNPFLTKFIRENYKSAKSFTIRNANIVGKTLKLECVIKSKNDKVKRTVLTVNNFNPNMTVMPARDSSNVFKVENKNSAPFIFKVKRYGNVIKCEGMRYNFVTKSIKEGKKARVQGNLVKENRSVRKK